jgi:hypothetical protein
VAQYKKCRERAANEHLKLHEVWSRSFKRVSISSTLRFIIGGLCRPKPFYCRRDPSSRAASETVEHGQMPATAEAEA